MAVTINKTVPAETQAEPVTTSPEVNIPVETSTPDKPRKRNNHSRALDIQGIDLPVAPDLLGLVEVVYGPLMAQTLRMIAYPLAPRTGVAGH